MSIKDLLEKVKPFYNLLLILVIACIFFALGRLSALEEKHVPIKIVYPNEVQKASAIEAIMSTGASSPDLSQNINESGIIIGSKTGKKYYFPWCGTVKMIKQENQIKFASIEDARKSGYTPAANCKGLK